PGPLVPVRLQRGRHGHHRGGDPARLADAPGAAAARGHARGALTLPVRTLPTMPRLARRFQTLPPYPLTDVPGIKRDLRARGVDVIDLGTGAADLAPPPAAVQALRQAACDA